MKLVFKMMVSETQLLKITVRRNISFLPGASKAF